MSIQPHGGKLINLKASEEERKLLLAQCLIMKKIQVENRVISDIVLLAVGAYSPLKGFMGKEDYESVVSHMQLSNGKLWPIPITFPVSREVAEDIEEGSQVAILDNQLQYIAVLKVEEKFSYSKEKEAHHVFQTTDINHPGVAHLYRQGDVLLGGPIRLIQLPNMPFQEYHLEPEQSRKYFQEKGWNTVTAFQTRNPIHRAHEYIQKCALEITDGLFIHPLVGETKKDDVPADVRIKSYEVLLEHYYPQEKVCLSVFPAAMRYAGPREAVFHAICRKNYGCTHIIIGRDHAGVGNYYGTYDAQALIKSLPVEELGITPLCFEHAFYCQKCEGMTSYKTCPHESAHHVFLSGTKVRERLQQGLSLPPEFTRPQVAQVLKEAYQKRRVSRK